MKKRKFIKVASIAAAGSIILPMGCNSGNEKSSQTSTTEQKSTTDFELPGLPYAYDALEPHIDARTMEIHHGKHHAGYVRKLNAAISESPSYQGKTLEEILASVNPDDTAIRNNGGGHYNHDLFWKMMSPKPSKPNENMLSALRSSFGSFDQFKEAFADAAKGRFGSGWAWLVADQNNKPIVISTPNQDNPLMGKIVGKTHFPLFGIDVWEHAYYLKYQNRRSDYIDNFFNLINWDAVTKRYMDRVLKK